MEHPIRPVSQKEKTNRRSFLKNGTVAAGAATLGAGLLTDAVSAYAQDDTGLPVTRGDIAILRFLSALEQVESDLWIRYAELGGATNQGLSAIDLVQNDKKINTGLAANYVTALQALDGDMPQYIVDNTDDEISHHAFLNNYLASLGAKPIDLSAFKILPPSQNSNLCARPVSKNHVRLQNQQDIARLRSIVTRSPSPKVERRRSNSRA